MPWDVIVLIGGGLSLGTAVASSGLLVTIGSTLENAVGGHGIAVALGAFSLLVAILVRFAPR